MSDLDDRTTQPENDAARRVGRSKSLVRVRAWRWVLARSGYIIVGLTVLQNLILAAKDDLGT